MRTSTGILGTIVAVGALLVGSANGKTAEARSAAPAIQTATAAAPATVPAATVEPVVTARVLVVESAAVDAEPVIERVSPPTLLQGRRLRRLDNAEVSPAMLQLAARIVHTYYAKPVGTEVQVHVAGQRVVAVIERHFHPEGGPVKPWGFHPGVSLFVPR